MVDKVKVSMDQNNIAHVGPMIHSLSESSSFGANILMIAAIASSFVVFDDALYWERLLV